MALKKLEDIWTYYGRGVQKFSNFWIKGFNIIPDVYAVSYQDLIKKWLIESLDRIYIYFMLSKRKYSFSWNLLYHLLCENTLQKCCVSSSFENLKSELGSKCRLPIPDVSGSHCRFPLC